MVIKLDQIISAKYFTDPMSDDNTVMGISCKMENKSIVSIPIDDKNLDYIEIMRLVDEGLLTIAEAD